MDLFARRYEAPGAALIVSDLLDCREELHDGLPRLGPARCAVSVIHLQSPADSRPGMDGPMLLRDAESGRQMSLAVTAAVKESYHRAWSAFTDGCRRACLGRGVTYVPAETDVPFEMLVLQTLRRAGVLSG
jgi:hypothetical protein